MKLHLPVTLRKSVLACMALSLVCTLGSGSLAHASSLMLDGDDSLIIDYEEANAIQDLNNGTLLLGCDIELSLSGCGQGDGKTYTLITGISSLLDADGNELVLDATNNAISNYFDTTQPGTGFWAEATLQLTDDGNLQLVRHNESVKNAVTLTTRQEGGVNYQYYESVSFKNITKAATSARGGAVYCEDGSITLSENGSVMFSGNKASASARDYFGDTAAYASGGAIFGKQGSAITLSNNGSVTFSGNTANASSSAVNASAQGGAIHCWDDTITLSENGSVTFIGNTANAYATTYGSANAQGGAIFGDEGSTITLSNNGSVTFSGNTASATASGSADAQGGAIFGKQGSAITLSNNGSVTFIGNTASASARATAYAYGGAIRGRTITLSENGSVTFSGNTASASDSDSATSSDSAVSAWAYAYGGAISCSSSITLSENGSVEFSGNTASASATASDSADVSASDASAYAYAYGGAIYSDGSPITLSENGSVTFSGNTASASAYVSASDAYDDASAYAYGGAIDCYYSTITLSENGSVTFSGNTASATATASADARGGAIYSYGNLNIQNNESVLFEKNAEITNGTYRLRSIYAGGRGVVISLSAAEGKSIEFRDSVYIDSGSTMNLNVDYTDADGVVHKQAGDILFTGAYTETHLNDLLDAAGAGRTATAQEILNSRTSEVRAMTNLYGGRLRVEDGAIYKGYGITAMEGSEATVLVKDATLEHQGYELTFNAGTTLELVGTNTLVGHVNLLEGSTLSFSSPETLGVTTVQGNLTIGEALTVSGIDSWQGENNILLYALGDITGWNADNITIQGATANTLTWVDDLLVLNYNADTFKVDPFRGDVSYTTRLTGDVNCLYCQSVSFKDITYDASSTAYGGAIYGYSSSITLSEKGSVTFSGNTANASADADGGAIYGYSSSITLSENGSVTFSGNTASASSSGSPYPDARGWGGAIYGSTTITLSENGSVTFSGNTASATASASARADAEARGGAIYGGTITLSENGSVTFSGNTASATATASASAYAYAYAYGGAIYGRRITLSENGSVTFSGNTASASATTSADAYANASADAYGGAIYGDYYSTITLRDNGSVTFSGNTASASADAAASARAYGGAIYSYGNLNIQNNESVLFEKNAEITNGTYRLRSIYAGGTGDVISLSAAEGKSIEFRDSVYIDSGSTMNLNAEYTDAAGVVHKQAGDILFTGAYTETHLNDLLEAAGAGRTATAQEILNSRTSVVSTMTNLYGGRLRVEEGAIYKGNGITAMEGSEATVLVKDAMLDHQGYELTFNAGTTLELVGTNTLVGHVDLLEGSTLSFSSPETLGMTTIQGNLTMGEALTVSGIDSWQGENNILLYAQGDITGWNADNITIQGATANTLTWVDDLLVLNYNADTFKVAPYRGDISYTTRLTGDVNCQYYQSVSFKDITNAVSSTTSYASAYTYGGAIHGNSRSTITLSDNSSVEFSGNTASASSTSSSYDNAYASANAYGGAISGGYGSTISLSENGRVTFSGNTASASATASADADAAAYGGAIDGDYNSITLSENGSVTFSGNTASASVDTASVSAYANASARACGGAISRFTSITLSENGSVTFIGNTASVSSSSAATARARAYANGGAIYGSTITLSENGSVTFSGNTASATASGSASAQGGAIYSYGNLNIQNNESVLFEKNAEITDGTYRLRSIYAGGTGDVISLSAAEGKSIEFRDSVYIDSGSTVNLNVDYTDAAGVVHKQAGDILFTGAYTETHLNDLLDAAEAGRTATAQEILNSRTSEVRAMTNLYGGRLRVEDGAIYKGNGITAMKGSEATVLVKDATLVHAGYNLTFNAGTTLELEGTNSVSGNIQMLEGSTLRFIGGMDVLDSPGMTLSGSLTLCDSVTLQMVGFGTGNYLLMDVSGATLNGWNTDALTVIDEDGAQLDSSLFVWDGDVLYYVNREALNLAWTNASGNGAWDNQSHNWESEGTAYASSLLNNVSFGANAGEMITLSGQIVVNKMTVQQDGHYTFAEGANGTSLTVRDKLTLEAGASADIQLRGGVKVNGALESAGELKVNKVTGAGSVSISGGSLELADDVDALAVTGTVSITNAELRGEWTGTGLNIGNSSVAAGADVTLKDVTISSTLSNEGNLVLGGTVTVQADGLDAPTSTTKYSAGESGYRYQEYAYTLVTGDGSSRALNGTQWDVQGGEMGTYSYADGVLSVAGEQDKTQYWVNGIVTYDGRAEFDSANTLVLNGGHLKLNTGLGSNLSQGIRVDASGTLTLGSGVQLGRGDITGMDTNKVVTLQGQGSLSLGSSADFSGYTLGKEWTGTVKLANITADTNLIMNTIGQAGSTIELENVMGYTGVNGKTVAANLVLTRSCDANGAEQAAFLVSNGYSNAASDNVMTTFSGTVSGAGKMVFDKMLSGVYTGFKFTGNVADWTGAFEMKAGKTFNLVFGGSATEIKADIRNISSNGTLNLVLQANDAMIVKGDVVTDSISVTNGKDVSFSGTVNAGALTAENSNITIASVAEVSGDMTVAGLLVQNGGSLTVGGTLCAGEITMDTISANSSALMVGQFGAGDTIFHLEIEDLNALNLGHGESVTIARAENTIDSDFNAWLGEGMTSLDAAVYRYDISVSGTDVQVSMDYANWGMRVWYQNGWVGMEDWDEYLVAGYDAMNGVETVDLGGETVDGVMLLIAPGAANATTVLSHGEMVVEMAEVVDGQLQIAADATLDTTEMAAEGKEIHLLGELKLSEGRIGTLSGTTGKLSIASGGEVTIDSSVTLGTLTNSGTLDIGKNKLNVAAAVTTGGNVIAGEVVAHNRANKAAVFNALVADKVTVTNSLSSNSYKDAISLGDGSAIGELIAETLEVRGGMVTLGRTEGSTSLTLQGLDLQNDATLLLNQQTQLAVTESMSATENATVQLKQGAGISYGATSISNGGQVETTTVNAYELATGNLKKVENAHVAVDSDADTTVDYQLVNSTLEKHGKGTLTVTSEGNSINAVSATGGTINVMNVASSDLESIMKLASLELQDGATFGAYVGSTVDADAEATVQVTGSAVFGSGTTINADLELMDGCSLTLNGPVNMGSNLKINGTITLNGDLLAQILSAELDTSFVLFSGIDNLYLHGTQYESISLSDQMSASTYFAGLNDDEYRRYWLTYESAVPGAGVLSVHVVVPEPATTTLSLLALAALVARRRRR